MAPPFISETLGNQHWKHQHFPQCIAIRDELWEGWRAERPVTVKRFFFPTSIQPDKRWSRSGSLDITSLYNITCTCLPGIGFNGPWSRVPAPGLALTFSTRECNTVYSSCISTGLWKNMSSPWPTWTSFWWTCMSCLDFREPLQKVSSWTSKAPTCKAENMLIHRRLCKTNNWFTKDSGMCPGDDIGLKRTERLELWDPLKNTTLKWTF